MAYYVPLGSRGLLLRVGTRVISVFGGLIYWRASLRRRLSPTPLVLVSFLPELDYSQAEA